MRAFEAEALIIAVLEQVDDAQLPEGRIEHTHDGKTILWFGGHGMHLGSATSGDPRTNEARRDPEVYRRDAARQALELEATYRADLAMLNEQTNGSE